MQQLHSFLRTKHCGKVVSGETNCWLCPPSCAGAPGVARVQECCAAMGTHVWYNPVQPSRFCMWACAPLCDGICDCVIWSLCRPILLSFTTSPFALSLASFVYYVSHSQCPLSLLYTLVQGPLHYCYLCVYSHPPFGHLLMSLSATLSPTNIVVGDNNSDIVPRETPCFCGTVFCTLGLCLSMYVPWNNSPMR